MRKTRKKRENDLDTMVKAIGGLVFMVTMLPDMKRILDTIDTMNDEEREQYKEIVKEMVKPMLGDF